MRVVFGLVLVLGLALAGFAVYMAQDYIGVYQSELASERAARASVVPTVDVFVVKRAVRYGERLREDDVRSVKWPENAIPEGAFQTKEALFPTNTDELRTVLRAMEKDEAVLAVKVTQPGEDAGVSSRLTKGMRAFAIKVDVTSGVSGFLRPGDRVDVYWTGQNFNSDGSTHGGDITSLIESKVKILAIDQFADQDRNTATIARTVTVEVSPQQVGTLAQAQATGRLALSLVGAEDENATGSVEVDSRILLGREERQVVRAEQERVCTIRTRKGAEFVETPIACAD